MKPTCPNCKVVGKLMVVTTEKHFHFITHIESDSTYEAQEKGIDKYFMVTDEEFICDVCNKCFELDELIISHTGLVH
jgi:uncharacterized protein YbaR (Trm112 family)